MRTFGINRNIYVFAQIAYCVTMALLVLLWGVLTGPLYEVYIDISVNPPEMIRKTDFSWITVNEWFNSQSYIITSHSTLKKVETPISISRLRKIVSAKRLGGADIIRISAKSNNRPRELENLVLGITTLYLEELNKSVEEMQKPVKQKTAVAKISLEPLREKRAEIKKEITLAKSSLDKHQAELEGLKTQAPSLKDIEGKISQITAKISPLKQKISDLRMVYAEGWHEIVELKSKIEGLEKERSAFYLRVPEAQKTENKKLELEEKIREKKQVVLACENELGQIEYKLKVAEEKVKKPVVADKAQIAPAQDEIEKEELCGYIINPPTLNLFPELGIRIIMGGTVSVIIWFLLGIIVRKK